MKPTQLCSCTVSCTSKSGTHLKKTKVWMDGSLVGCGSVRAWGALFVQILEKTCMSRLKEV